LVEGIALYPSLNCGQLILPRFAHRLEHQSSMVSIYWPIVLRVVLPGANSAGDALDHFAFNYLRHRRLPFLGLLMLTNAAVKPVAGEGTSAGLEPPGRI